MSRGTEGESDAVKLLLLNLILLASAGSVSYGLWLHSNPLAYVICGMGVGLAAFVTGVAIGDKPSTQPVQRGNQNDRV